MTTIILTPIFVALALCWGADALWQWVWREDE